jgi:hypothetical protein
MNKPFTQQSGRCKLLVTIFTGHVDYYFYNTNILAFISAVIAGSVQLCANKTLLSFAGFAIIASYTTGAG